MNFCVSGRYAFFANKEYIIYRLQKVLPLTEAVNIIDTGQDFLVRGIGFGLQKNSPYRKLFNHVLVKLGGLVNHVLVKLGGLFNHVLVKLGGFKLLEGANVRYKGKMGSLPSY